MRYTLLVGLILLSSLIIYGQENELEIYGWEDHFSYKHIYQITHSDTKLYASSDHAIVVYDLEDLSSKTYSKVQGLSDINPYYIHYFKDEKALIVVYDNSNIDIIYQDDIKNLPELFNNKNLLGQKTINGLYADEENGKTWIFGDFGVTSIDMNEGVFDKTIFTTGSIHSFKKSGDSYFLIQEGELYHYPIANEGIVNFENWINISQSDPLLSTVNLDDIEIYENFIIVADRSNIYASTLASPAFEKIYEYTAPQKFKKFMFDGVSFYAVTEEPPYQKNQLYQLAIEDDTLALNHIFNQCIYGILDIVHVGDKQYFANERGSLVSIDNNGECLTTSINSPHFSYVHNLEFYDDNLYVTTGGVNIEFYPTSTYQVDGYTVYDGEEWTAHSFSTDSILNKEQFINILQTLHVPNSNKLYLNSYYKGLLEIDTETNSYKIYNEENSCFSPVIVIGAETRVTSIALDEENNIWASNYLAETGLIKIDDEGNCQSFKFPQRSTENIGSILIDKNGLIWCTIVDNSNGLFVFNPETEQSVMINSSNSELVDNNVTAIAEDLNGSIWVGSNSGVTVFSCGNRIFENICASVPIVNIDGDEIGDPLLLSQSVRCIAIDDANRKWFGTQNGLIVQSSSSDKTIFHFTEKNSPLPSNVINDIAIDRERGIIYIGTDKGLVSFKGDAVEANNVHAAEIISYPNPVRPEYQGPIVIKGLANNARVKITDQRGYVVTEIFARGGQAVWDGLNSSGQRVASGVYMIYSSGQSDLTKPDAHVGKIVVIK